MVHICPWQRYKQSHYHYIHTYLSILTLVLYLRSSFPCLGFSLSIQVTASNVLPEKHWEIPLQFYNTSPQPQISQNSMMYATHLHYITSTCTTVTPRKIIKYNTPNICNPFPVQFITGLFKTIRDTEREVWKWMNTVEYNGENHNSPQRWMRGKVVFQILLLMYSRSLLATSDSSILGGLPRLLGPLAPVACNRSLL